MKALLGSLLCLVLFASECFAIKGGPVYPTGSIVTTGNYAGVLYPPANENSLGIFVVTVPTTGIATGTVAFFRNGYYYAGTVQGIADPDSAMFIGVADATLSITFAGSSTSTSSSFLVVTFNASGDIFAKIAADPNSFSSVSARLSGTAGITYVVVDPLDQQQANAGDSNGPINYIVDGFKQSEIGG
ncbi:MAG TPA: hypothetical protein VGG02_09515 [Chthoniobacterales bacterium]|jgi:hypothetical protein